MLLLVTATVGWAEDTPAQDAATPAPYDPSAASQALLQSSPFTRTLDPSDSLLLTGLAYVDGKPVATIKDRLKNKSYVVSEQPNELGWKLAGATPSNELRRAEVKLMIGSETVTIRYSDAQIALKGRPGPTRYPTDAEAIRNDENGKPYVRASVYLSDSDKERYYRGWSREGHEKFRDVVRNARDKMFAAKPEERAAMAKKMFEEIDATERARAGK